MGGLIFSLYFQLDTITRMIRRPRTIWPWIVATLIGAPVLYVLSFGPVCWTVSWMRRGEETIAAVYAPLLRVWADGPAQLSNAVDFYANRAGSLEKRLTIYKVESPGGNRTLIIIVIGDANGSGYGIDPFM